MSSRRRMLALSFVAGGMLLATATPAQAADLFVRVTPSTVQAGGQVGIEASCNSNMLPAMVESPAFGTVTVQPQNGTLTGAAMVPADTPVDSYRVQLTCPDGRTAATRLNVVAATMPSRGPATGFGGAAGEATEGALLTGGIAAAIAGAVVAISAHRRRASVAGRRTGR